MDYREKLMFDITGYRSGMRDSEFNFERKLRTDYNLSIEDLGNNYVVYVSYDLTEENVSSIESFMPGNYIDYEYKFKIHPERFPELDLTEFTHSEYIELYEDIKSFVTNFIEDVIDDRISA